MNDKQHGFAWYLAGVVCQFLPFGVHGVLYAWLVAVYLGENGLWLGVAQMAAQLPALLFVLFAGALADRVDRRRILITCHLAATVPALLLAVTISAGTLNYAIVIVFALAVSALNSFIQPARDSLLNQVTRMNLQKSVTIVMGLSFFSQIVGYGVASQADNVGPVPLLLVQAIVVGLGGVLSVRLPKSEFAVLTGPRRGTLSDIGEGLSLVFSSPRMAPVMILMFAIGVFYTAAFTVANPLVVRDIYGGGSADIALSFMVFMSGTIVTAAILIAVGGIDRQGLGLMLALVIGGLVLLITVIGLPFWGYLVCIGCWGICAGVAMSLARSIIQESAPDNFRARAMSIYTLGMLGGTPIGAPVIGYICTQTGPLNAYAVCVAGIFATVLLVWVTSKIVEVDRMEINSV